MNKFILTHSNGIVTIKIDANIEVNSKTQRIIESMCKNAVDKIADYLEVFDKTSCTDSLDKLSDLEGKDDGFGNKTVGNNQ